MYDVAAAQPDAMVDKGYGVRNARIEKAPAEIARFLIENGYIEGEIASLPEYSESVLVTVVVPQGGTPEFVQGFRWGIVSNIAISPAVEQNLFCFS